MMDERSPDGQGDIVIYQTEDGVTKIDVRFVDETVWLTQAQLVQLFQTSKANVSEHIKNIFAEGELDEASVVRKFRTTVADGKNYLVSHYYLDKDELSILNGIVSGYFDFAEIQAKRHNPMYMSDYVEHLDKILQSTVEQVLVGPGSVSDEKAMEKARREYRRFQVKTLSPVEVAYLETIKSVSRIAKRKGKSPKDTNDGEGKKK